MSPQLNIICIISENHTELKTAIILSMTYSCRIWFSQNSQAGNISWSKQI